MSGILIVGNSIKDVFLKLDERKNHAEKDKHGVSWINLGFNGSSYEFMRHTAVASGAAVTHEVLTNFGIRAEIMGNPSGAPVDYRYILNMNEGEVAYFSSSDRPLTRWVAPETPPYWILIDRSAEMSEELMDEILKYLDKHKETRLAIYVSKNTTLAETRLVQAAKIIFAENSDWMGSDGAITVTLSDNSMRVGDKTIKWWTKRSDLMTHLTVNTIATTTFFAALLRGESVDMALKFVRQNVESSALSSSLTYSKMKQMMELKNSEKSDLRMVAKMLMSEGRGILAADESGGSIHKKFEEAGIPDDVEHRRDYRNIFLSAPGLEKYVNGVILFDETARQSADNGQNFVEYLTMRGVIPGIKVDQGLEVIPGNEAGEKYTLGLDDLPERLKEYQEMGLRFAKWRAAFEVGAALPSSAAIDKNCEILAEYARLCQEAGIVPIVEPEVVYDGNYSLRRCARVSAEVLESLFKHLKSEEVDLAACIVKTNMVLAGKRYSIRSTANEVGRETAKLLSEKVPAELAGVVFLSGGQDVAQATENLAAVIAFADLNFPLTFSFARAVQGPALDAWKGDNANKEAAQEAFLTRLKANCGALIK